MRAALSRAVTATAKKTARVQYAALPYRMTGETVEILVITSLRSHRWIIPKGWPMEGFEPSACAAREALEEAGIMGEVDPRAIGSYRYEKQLKVGSSVPCKVEVFAMKVMRQRRTWDEKDARELCWLPLAQAAATVDEPDLRRLILKFGAQLRSTADQKGSGY